MRKTALLCLSLTLLGGRLWAWPFPPLPQCTLSFPACDSGMCYVPLAGSKCEQAAQDCVDDGYCSTCSSDGGPDNGVCHN